QTIIVSLFLLSPYSTLFRSPAVGVEIDERGGDARVHAPGADHDADSGALERAAALTEGDRRREGAAELVDESVAVEVEHAHERADRKSTRLNSSHVKISYAV